MNFRQVRKKIKTVGNVKQITKAMQMVASVKMKKAQEAASVGKIYRQILDAVVKKVLKNVEGKKIPYSVTSSSGNKKLYILISSNKGLSGGFNFNLFKLILKSVTFEDADFIVVGKKGADFISRTKSAVIADFSKSSPFTEAVSPIFSVASSEFMKGTYSSVYLVYNSFISTVNQEPTIKMLLPIISSEMVKPETEGDKKIPDKQYLIEPSEEEVLFALVDDYLRDKIRGAVLESEAAEHSARMMAMKSATDNATELIFNLTLLRNKVRQTAITNELLDITTAQLSSES